MKRLQLLPLAIVLLLGNACISTGTPKVGGKPVILGSLELSGPTFGQHQLSPTECDSGENEVFLGADFSSPDSPLVTRLVIDPLQGPGVRIFSREARFEKAVVLRQEDCPSFRFSLDRNGWQVNDVYVMKVHLELDCALPNGDRVKGSVDAPSCW